MSLEVNGNAPPFVTNSLVAGWSPPLSPPSSPVQPMTLCGKKGSSRVCPPDRKEANILDKIWLGSHNVTLLTRFVLCHFSGDWSVYLPFAHLADSWSLEHPDLEICLNKELLLKLDSDVGGAPGIGNSGENNRASGDHGGRDLGHNIMCNKTVADVVDSVHSSRTGDRAGTPSPCWLASSFKTSPKNSLFGHPDICTMFPSVRVRTPDKNAAAQAMEDNIALQESKEGAHRKQVEALWVKFAAAAELKSITKKKGVSWSSQETHLDQGSLDDKMEGPLTDGVSADNRPQPKQGSKYRKSLKLSRLAAQVSEQEHLATTANLLACSLRTGTAAPGSFHSNSGRPTPGGRCAFSFNCTRHSICDGGAQVAPFSLSLQLFARILWLALHLWTHFWGLQRSLLRVHRHWTAPQPWIHPTIRLLHTIDCQQTSKTILHAGRACFWCPTGLLPEVKDTFCFCRLAVSILKIRIWRPPCCLV